MLLETFLGSIVEIVLFLVLLAGNNPADDRLIAVIQSAILGSILANLLLCLGLCFFTGGLRYEKQEFDGMISEVCSGLLLVAGFGLAIPCIFSSGVRATNQDIEPIELANAILKISRATAVILLIAFGIYVFFLMRTHHKLIDVVLEADEARDTDREHDLKKRKLTLIESALALTIAITFVSLHAIFLVKEIEPIINNSNISDMFMGLILVPFVGV